MASRPTAATSPPSPRRSSRVPLVLALLGGLSMLPPYLGAPLGLELDVRESVEFVDHVLPGAIIALCGGLGVLLARRGHPGQDGVPGLLLYSSAFLAGLFQTATTCRCSSMQANRSRRGEPCCSTRRLPRRSPQSPSG